MTAVVLVRLSPVSLAACCMPFAGKRVHPLGHAAHCFDRSDAMASAPCGLPTRNVRSSLGQEASIRFNDAVIPKGGRQKIRWNASHSIGQHDVVSTSAAQRRFVAIGGEALMRGDEWRADVCEVGTGYLRGAHLTPRGDTTCHGQRAAPETAYLLNEGKGLSQPVLPPAPAVSSTSMSTPASIAFLAWRIVATSASTRPPYARTRSTTGAGEPTEVMIHGI